MHEGAVMYDTSDLDEFLSWLDYLEA
jgi:hypothetical protein